MATIPITDVGTSRPADICHTNAQPLIWPGNLKLGVKRSGPIWNGDWTILAFKIKLNVGYQFFLGVCGPGWGACMKLEGETTGDNISLAVTDDQIEAGLALGATVGLSFSLDTEYYSCWITKWNWWGPSVSCGWNNLFSELNIGGLNLDLIKMVYEILKALLGKEPAVKPTKKDPPKVVDNPISVQSYGILDGQSNTYNSAFWWNSKKAGELRAEPVFSVPINLWHALVLADTSSAVCGGSAVAIDKAIKAAKGQLGFGPSFGLKFPVTVKVNEVHLNGTAKYKDMTYNTTSGRLTGVRYEGTAPATVSSVKVKFAQSPGVDLAIGLFASFTLLECISLSWEGSLGVLGLLGINVSAGPFYYTSGPHTAGTNLSKTCGSCSIDTGMYEVAFE